MIFKFYNALQMYIQKAEKKPRLVAWLWGPIFSIQLDKAKWATFGHEYMAQIAHKVMKNSFFGTNALYLSIISPNFTHAF